MSLSREKREIIKRYILERIKGKDGEIAKTTAKVFNITPNSVYRYLKNLTDENIVQKTGKDYQLVINPVLSIIPAKDVHQLEEDKIYSKYVDSYISKFPENIIDIWKYCFTEMMNNAIDHSEASEFQLFISQTYIDTTIILHDNGVGIFKKISEHFHFDSYKDVSAELFKGKLTTDKDHHTGEGIFFTSRILDSFAAISDNTYFTRNKYSEITRDLEEVPILSKSTVFKSGTTIFMQLSNFSRKTTRDVFNEYSSIDGGFTRTSIPLKYIYDNYPVSRSQAKRLSHRFDSFKEVILDFSDIDDIGQGFAHELFVVYKNNHKNILLSVVNASDNVKKMINHVTLSSDK